MSSCKQKDTASKATSGAAALYVHVPFCRSKCRYCDFYSLGGRDSADVESYISAALAELEEEVRWLRVPLRTVFIGGGTPTSIGAPALESLLQAIEPLTAPRTEFSVEANPGTFDDLVAGVLVDAGVTRVNFGVQSFQERELEVLGRVHRSDQAVQAVRLAHRVGLRHIGLDLIYGIPGQSIETWQRSLDLALSLPIDHLSCYALSFEQGTPLWQDRAAGRVQEAGEDLQRQCYDLAISHCEQAGLEHYEISNFARAGAQCAHNMIYWRNEPYLGIGPGAASYINGVRRTNTPDLTAYIKALATGKDAPHSAETLGLRQRMGETLMLGLRVIEGVNLEDFESRFGQDAVEAFPQSVGRYLQQKALIIENGRLHLARWALFASDTVLADVVSEAGN